MNYLAHALLAGPDDDYRLGALLGDFVKGPLLPAPPGLSAALQRGLALHRRIDSFADAHVAFCRSRQRISPERRRYSGVIVDVVYDHFLAVHWAEFSEQPLASFTAGGDALLAQRSPLPDRLAQILPRMRREDWLAGYREPAAAGRALDQIAAHRIRRQNSLAGAGSELSSAYPHFERDFLDFFPAAMDFAEHSRREMGGGGRDGKHESGQSGDCAA